MIETGCKLTFGEETVALRVFTAERPRQQLLVQSHRLRQLRVDAVETGGAEVSQHHVA